MSLEEEDAGMSSEEEFNSFLESKQIQKHVIREGDEEADEFEDEMERELDALVCNLEKKNALREPSVSFPSKKEEPLEKVKDKIYNEIYFDSDEEETIGVISKKKSRKVLTNDELFYDPNADDDDQTWVDDVRRSYQPKQSDPSKKRNLPKSDAILSCPCCMTTLCRDCQRHEIYTSQFRAMFVMNCNIDFGKKLLYSFPNEKKNPGKKKRKSLKLSPLTDLSVVANEDEDQPNEELYFGVKCAICKVDVGVYDTEEVYHFFGVIAN